MSSRINPSQPFQFSSPVSAVLSFHLEGARSDQKTIQGILSLLKRTPRKIGTDTHYGFKERITVENGKYLKISPNDLIYFCELKHKNESREQAPTKIELPSSLFEQARRGNRVYFAQDGIDYELELSSQWDEQCVKGNVKKSFHEFLYEEDVPSDYCLFVRQHGCPYFLSPEAKRIALNTKGTSPLNFSELKEVAVNGSPQVLLESGKGNKSVREEEYAVMLAAYGKCKVEIVLDANRLFVLIIPEPIDSRWEVLKNTLPTPPLFFKKVIAVDGKEIDQSNVFASLNDCGALTILVPFSNAEQTNTDPSQNPPVHADHSLIEVNQASLDVNSLPTKTRILARCDVGMGNQLFVRGQGAPFLNWDRGVKMECVQGPDLWALEFDSSDSATLKFKFLVNDQTWENGNNHEIEPGKTQEMTPYFW